MKKGMGDQAVISEKKVDLRRLLLAAGAAMVVLIALLFWAQEIIREVVVLPLSYLFWMIGVLIDTTPQLFFWISGGVLALVIVIGAFSDRPKATVQVPLVDLPDLAPTNGRVLYWSNRVNMLHSGRGVYYERLYHAGLQRLLFDLLAYRFHLTPKQVEEQLHEGALAVPDDVRDYLLHSLALQQLESRSRWAILQEWFEDKFGPLYQRIRKWAGAPEQEIGVDPKLALILKYMEDELEVSNDDFRR